jgi:hypothetical protein
LGDMVAEREGIYAGLESVWQAKREYRAEMAKKRALRFSEYREALTLLPDFSDAHLSTGDLSIGFQMHLKRRNLRRNSTG